MNGKILLVDDNEELCRNLSDILEFKGYEVNTVFDGSQAIENIKNNAYDVVVMDVKMPGLSGIETLKLAKQISPGLKVIMITAFADDFVYKTGFKTDELEIMQKPMDIDKFLARIEEIVSAKKKAVP